MLSAQGVFVCRAGKERKTDKGKDVEERPEVLWRTVFLTETRAARLSDLAARVIRPAYGGCTTSVRGVKYLSSGVSDYESSTVIPIYMSIPIMSLVMAINGPVAMAGSIFSFSSVMGTSVPKMEANITTANRLMETE